MIQCVPSSESVAVVVMLAGSEPAFTSVSANAVIAPFAMRGKYFLFCSSVPNSARGCGTPIDCDAETSATSEPHFDVISSIAFTYDICERPSPPYSAGILIPIAPMPRNASTAESLIRPVRSVSSASYDSRNARSVSRNGFARSASAGSSIGCGWISSARNRPRKSSRTKLGCCHSVSRARSATSRASASEAGAFCMWSAMPDS